MASNVIVRQHIDTLLTTSTLAGAQSTLGINPGVTTTVQANSAAWGTVNQAALDLKSNRNAPTFTGVLSATGPVIIDVSSSTNALRITQAGSGPALLVEDSNNPDVSPFIITSTGDVGIGKTPGTKLEVEGSDTITRFSGTLSQNNGIAINNTFANAATFKLGYIDFRNENNVTVSKIYSNINTAGSSDIILATTDAGDRTTTRLAERMRVTATGSVGIGTATPSAALHVNGNIIGNGITASGPIAAGSITLSQGANSTLFIPTSAKVQFGNPGDNTDDFYIQRVNPGQYFGGKSELRINLGDDPQASGVFSATSSTYVDSVVIGVNGHLPWQPKIVLESHGLISCFGDYLPSNNNPLTATPAIPVSGAHLTTKQYVDQFRTPPGAIMTFAMSAAPTGWLYCNGQQVSRVTYAALFSAIGTTYGAGNGSSTFNLPDLRGEFIRGWDNGRGIDTGRAFGSTQKGTITVADPNLNSLNVAGIYCQFEYNTSTFAPVAGYDIVNINDYAGVYRAHISGTGFGALETNGFAQGATRPRNIALYYCIKF
jgi:hypothetical protein